MKSKDTTFLFILGRGRSGTSLMQTILNTHPNISVAPEGQFIMFLYNRYHKANWSKKKIEQFSKDIWLEERLENWHLDKEILKKELLHNGEDVDYSDLCKEVYYQYGKSKEKDDLKVVGDKNPHYSLYLERLISLYPNAKFIHVVRDPRDTILSYKNVNFDSNNSATLAHRWNIYNKAIEKQKNKHEHLFWTLRFEDLLIKPEQKLTELCKFLNVPYDSEMLEFYKKEQDWEAEFRKNLKNPLDPAKAFQWKKKMSKKEVSKINAIIGKRASHYGYEAHNIEKRYFPIFYKGLNLIYANWVTFLEKSIYYMPLSILAPAIAFYRKLTEPK